MSLKFNIVDQTQQPGIIQGIERRCGFNDGDISGDTSRLARVTAEVNLALDAYGTIAKKAAGMWLPDDSNQSDYPIVFADLTQGQRSITLNNDATGNQILDIYAVYLSDASGNYTKLQPVDYDEDLYNQPYNNGFYNGSTTQGIPTTYAKIGNGILFNFLPNYSKVSGVRLDVNREYAYFNVNDTTKKPGVQGNHHEYFIVRPSYYLAPLISDQNTVNRLKGELMEWEKIIADDFSIRQKDQRQGFGVRYENNK